MTKGRAMVMGGLSTLVLMGADHRESPVLGLTGPAGGVLEPEVVSWSWDGAEADEAGLPGRARTATFLLWAGPETEKLEQWARDRSVLPAARFESEKSGRLLRFELAGVTLEGVEDAPVGAVPAVRVTLRFRHVRSDDGSG